MVVHDVTRAIFLDIDGVLSTLGTPDAELDQRRVDLFNDMKGRVAPCFTILSSDWRLIPELREIVERRVRIFDVTPEIPGASRGEEIQVWLNEHPGIRDFIIIDDRDDFLPNQTLVQTEFREGLTKAHCEAVVNHFNKRWWRNR